MLALTAIRGQAIDTHFAVLVEEVLAPVAALNELCGIDGLTVDIRVLISNPVFELVKICLINLGRQEIWNVAEQIEVCGENNSAQVNHVEALLSVVEIYD